MAFGFNDFAKFFDPVSDLLGTSGKQGVGLLQQKPEDIAMTAAAVYLAMNGIPVTPESLAAAETATATTTAEAAAAEAAAQEATRLAAEKAAAEATRLAAQESAQQGILQANQLPSNLLADVNAKGIQTADAGGNFLERFGVKGVELNPAGAELPGAPYGTEEPTFIDKLFGRETGAVRLEPGPSGSFPQEFVPGGNLGPGGPYPSLDPYVPGGNLGPGGPYPSLDPYVPGGNLGPGGPYIEPVGDYGLNYTKPPVSEIGMESNFSLNPNQTSFRQAGDTDLSAALKPSQQAGLSDPTANIGNRLPYTEGNYRDTLDPFARGMDTAAKYFDKAGDYLDKASKYTETDPYKSAGLAYYGAYKTGMLDQEPVETPADNYKNPYNMGNFRRSNPNPNDYQYRPRYAEGGIASVRDYKKGGRTKTEAAMDFYDAMNPQRESAPLKHGDPGIYYDMDPDTRYLDPMEAATVRMSKLNSRTNVQAPTMTPNRRMGELDFKPVAAAQGGIMGYAAGGLNDKEPLIPTTTSMPGVKIIVGGGGRTTPEPDAKFSPTSEGAAAVSKFGQGLSSYPAMAPLGVAAKIAGALASNYGDHMARNVNPNYSNEGRQQMQASQSAAQDGRVAAFDAGRTHEGGGGGQGPSVSSNDFGGGAVDPAGRDSDGAPLAKGGGIMGYNLGGYAAGGNPRLLRGPGDGMSDHIPATINNRQPARLADGEYVITADVVSHLGNGSTEAGARQLDAMMKRIRKGRTGTPKQGKQINPRKYLPA